MLPAIAVLHVRHALARPSGAFLATIAGTTTVALGLAGSVNVDLQPAALVVLGMWWWTMGKMWAETGVLTGALGLPTATLGALAVAGGLYASFGTGLGAIRPGVPDVQVWTTLRVALAVWLLVLAAALVRDR